MSTETDWREAARGIPVWEGAQVCRIGLRGVGTVQTILPGGGGLALWGDGATLDPREFFPNLADPDTRAACDRRLALALGCPEAYADVGVRFRRLSSLSPSAGWIVEAGHDEHDFYDGPAWTSEPRTVAADAEDPLLARALAWPADKRVSR